MSGVGDCSSHLNAANGESISLSEQYRREQHLFSTRTSDGYQARNISSGEIFALWILRFALVANSTDAERFGRRLATIARLELPTAEFVRFGVDSSGVAYLLTKHRETSSIFDLSLDTSQPEQIFLEIVNILSKMHAGGIFFGDISGDSFVIDNQADVLIQGLLGSFDVSARQTAMLPPPDTLSYLAPEQQSGGGPSCASDVYALGVIAYRLFTGRSLHGKRTGTGIEDPAAVAPAPSVVRSSVPFWLDDVLGTCLQGQLARRYCDAEQLQNVIRNAISTGESPGGSSAWSRKTVSMSPAAVIEVQISKDLVKAASSAIEIVTPLGNKRPNGRVRRLIPWACGISLGVLLAAGVLLAFNYISREEIEIGNEPPAVESSQGYGFHLELLPGDLVNSGNLIIDPSSEFSEVQSALAELAGNDDTAVNAFLLEVIKKSPELRVRSATQHLLIERVRKQGLGRSADVLETWFSDLDRLQLNSEQSRAFGLFLRACETSRSDQLRIEALSEAYKLLPTVALQVAAALALDQSQEKFVPLLRALLSNAPGQESIQRLGFGGLLIADRSLHLFIDQNPEAAMKWFSDQDLSWALNRLAEQESELFIFEISSELLRRKILSPFRAAFVEALVQSRFETAPTGVRKSLVRAAVGDITGNELRLWARWNNSLAEQVLLAAVVSSRDGALSLEAFDILAGRRTSIEPTASLVNWVKTKSWKERSAVVRAIATLCLGNYASPADQNLALEQLAKYSDKGLFLAMVQSNDAELIRSGLSSFGGVAKSSELLPLLRHDDDKVRAGAVQALEGRNELAVLQGVLFGFEREKDPTIRKLYLDLHWVTRDREKR